MMVQATPAQAKNEKNALHELGYKIFLDRYAQKDMTRSTLAVGDRVIVVVDSATGQREIGTVKTMNLPNVTIELLDGEVVTRDVEHVDKPLETEPGQMMRRVAAGIAAAEPTQELRELWTERFNWLLEDWKFVPAGRILAAAGTNQSLTFYNCFVVPSPLDSRGGIIETLHRMTEIMSRGGGVGINVSSLRPRHAFVKGVNGRSSGAVSWGALYSFVTGLIEQGGCFGPDERIATNVGLIPTRELADRIDAGEHIYAHTHKGLRRITARFRNGVKPLYEVTTKRGYKVRITAEHKVAVLMDGKLTTMPLQYLAKGDEILLLLGSGVQTGYVELSPVDYQRSVMSTTLNENVRLPELLTEALAYLVGYMHGDGYVHIGKKVTWQAPKAIKLATADAHPSIRERLLQAIQHQFELEPTIETGDGACKNIAVHSRLLIEWLGANGLLKAKAESIRVPEAIFRSPSSVQAAFIAGYFDADGCNRGRKGGYGIDSINRAMLADVQQLLAANGIVSRIGVTDRSEQGQQTIYRLTVTGNRFKKRFANLIPAEKVTREANGIREENTYPVSVWTELGARTKYRQRIQDGVSDRISFAQLERIGERLEADGQEIHAQQLRELLNTIPDEIRSITPLGASEVYDFEVDDVHLLSGNGVYTSNSRRGALMLILNDWHPDVFDFINSKRKAGQITNANISVNVSDKLMDAVKADVDWDLVFPDTGDPDYDAQWDGNLEAWTAAGHKVVKYRTVKARDIWNAITESAWASAEPGIWFGERSNKMSNSWYFNPLICTNPCHAGDNLIHTREGLRPIRELVDKEFEVVSDLRTIYGVGVQYEKAYAYVTGQKPLFKLRLKTGQTIRLTANHNVFTRRGKVQVQDLRLGEDSVLIQSAPHLDALLPLDEEQVKKGRIVGWNAGDGWISQFPDNHQGTGINVGFIFNAEEVKARDFVVDFINESTSSPKPVTARLNQGCWEVQTSNTNTVSIFARYGLMPSTRKRVTPEIAGASLSFRIGFLQGLFSADGSLGRYKHSKTGNIILITVNKGLAEGVQILLADFGIKTYLRSRSEKGIKYATKNGEIRTSRARVAYSIRVAGQESVQRFARFVGFPMSDVKQSRLEALIADMETARQSCTDFWSEVVSVEPDGVETVYNLTTEISHTLVANGMVVANCGEQSLGAWSVCNLGALNLAKFYDEANHDVDWDSLDVATRYATRFLDNVIDSTPYFYDENRERQLSERRVGLNNMGLAELMIRLGIRYGSPESVKFIDKLYSFMTRAAYETSIDLAREKGPFPLFEADKFAQSGFIKTLPRDVQDGIRKQGIRNVTLLTQAPTGCVAPDTLISTSTGMQPIVTLGNPEGEQWQIKTYDVHTDVGLRKTSHFYVNGRQPVKKLTSKRGFTLTATHNHRVRIIDTHGNYVWRRMDELQAGDRVVLKKDTLTGNKAVTLTSVEQGNRALSDLPPTMTPELAELLGLYMGDGYLKQRGGLHIVVSDRDPDLMDYTGNLMREVWGERHVSREQHIGCTVLNLTGYYISRFFEANGFAKPSGNHGEGAAGAFIPPKVLEAGRDCVAAFLRGLFESDGSIHRGTITLTSTSQALIHQAQVALLGLGIVATQRQMPESPERFGKRPLYELRILNRREAEKFVAVVGFLSERKREKAATLGAISDRGDSIAVPALCEEFYVQSQGLKNEVRQQLVGLAGNGALTQQFVRTTVSEHPVLEGTRLAQLVQMDVFVDEVAGIEDGECDTYDLSVPDNHTYIANGFVSHNTTGTMVNTSTGIEPFFSWIYYRKSRLGLHEEQVPLVKEWYEQHPGETQLPDHFVTAMDLSPEDHVRVQAAIQRWVDSSISKTCNIPNEYTVEQTRQLYELMYELGCKGGTIYRDGSRDEQVLMLKGDERAESEMKKREESTKDVEIEPQTKATPHHVYPRPRKLLGATVTSQTPFGKAYITMNSDENNQPFEVFITAPGKAGSDLQADADGLGRLISLQLRSVAPMNRRQMLKLIIDQLQGIGGSRSIGMGPHRVMSLPDAVAGALEEQYFSEDSPTQLTLPMVASEPAQPVIHEAVGTYANGSKPHEFGVLSGADLCPSCHTVSLIRAEGCRKCLTCGYSEC